MHATPHFGMHGKNTVCVRHWGEQHVDSFVGAGDALQDALAFVKKTGQTKYAIAVHDKACIVHTSLSPLTGPLQVQQGPAGAGRYSHNLSPASP